MVPPDFIFSQSSLQDYVDCPRRFQLRYVVRCDWPAVQTEPIQISERHMARGQAFHRLVHQYHLGLAADLLAAVAHQADLDDWWQSLLAHGPTGLPSLRRAEASLSVPVSGYRLLAQYDLVAADEHRAVILDWKTNLKRPSRTFLEYRLQTRVYPFVLVAASQGAAPGRFPLTGGRPVAPSQVEMVYWFAEFPDQPEVFRYSQEQLEADARYLGDLVGGIARREDAVFPLTQDPRRCRFCVYRSFCERDVPAASYDDEEADLADAAEVQLDIEQVAEIVY